MLGGDELSFRGKMTLLLTKKIFMALRMTFVNLFQVKYIALRDIPSCSMQSLSQCSDVRSLMLENCGLLAVKGLDKCKELQELHVKVKCLQ